MSACPVCGHELPDDDAIGQIAHMESNHPDLIERRLVAAGFVKDAKGEWHDRLAGPDS